MKKLVSAIVVAISVILVLGSCGSAKQVAYFQNIDSLDLSASKMLYDARIMPKDQLSIIVKTTNEDAAKPFNLNTNNTSTMNQNLQYYLVDNDGNIDFPIVGKIHVLGLTGRQCEELIRTKIQKYFSENEKPFVTVRMASFRVVVTGEVGSPGVVTVPNEKISIVEALAQSGDLGLQGKRKNVMLIREDAAGTKSAHRLDLTDANLINSPYFYLQQNDIVYVEPNGAKKGTAGLSNSVTFWIGLVSSIISLATLTVSLCK